MRNTFNDRTEREQAKASASHKFKAQIVKDRERQTLADKTEAFLSEGGSVGKIGLGVSGVKVEYRNFALAKVQS